MVVSVGWCGRELCGSWVQGFAGTRSRPGGQCTRNSQGKLCAESRRLSTGFIGSAASVLWRGAAEWLYWAHAMQLRWNAARRAVAAAGSPGRASRSGKSEDDGLWMSSARAEVWSASSRGSSCKCRCPCAARRRMLWQVKYCACEDSCTRTPEGLSIAQKSSVSDMMERGVDGMYGSVGI